MDFSWSFADKMTVCRSSKGPRDGDGFFHPTVLRQDFQFDDEFLRQLIHEFYSVFAKLRALAVEPAEANALSSVELQKISLHYQTIVRSKMLRLKETENNKELVDDLTNIHLFWSLIDVLLLKTAENLPSFDLAEWSKFNFRCVEEDLQILLDVDGRGASASHSSAVPRPDFWKTVYSCLILGRVEECRRLLNSHARKMDPIFLSVDELLNNIPFSDDVEKSEWFHWQSECKRRLKENLYAAYPELKTVVRILSGDPKIYEELRQDSNLKWYQLIIGKTLFCHTFCKIYELTDVAASLFKSNSTDATKIDEILMSIFELDVVKTLQLCSSHFQNWVFVAHLADLLHFAGCTELALVEDTVNLREYLLLEYADSLMTHHSLWQLAADYYASCPTYGISSLKLNLERLPIDSGYKYMKVLEICEKFEFSDLARSLSKERCVQALKSGRLNKALSFCLQTKDSSLAGYLAQQFLKVHGRTGLIHTLKLLDDLGSSALLNTSLTFLGKYREFWRLKATNGDCELAASTMARLINSRLAPRQFWPILFEDALLLLRETDRRLFNSEELFALINSVENAALELDLLKNGHLFASENEQGLADVESFRTSISDLRLLLTKQLAFTLIA